MQPVSSNPDDSSKQAAGQFDVAYYRSGFGPIPYERNDYWLGFFAAMADEIARCLKPRTVLDAGCAKGFLVEALWARGIEAWGIDISAHAISQVRKDVGPYCRAASLTEPIQGFYDLVTCIEVVEHIPAEDVELVARNITGVTDTILFSSTSSDFDEATHVTVRPALFWLKLFNQYGFQPDLLFDASFINAHAMLLRKGQSLPEEVAILFSRMILYRSVLAASANQINSLKQQNTDLSRQIEAVSALEQQNAALRRQIETASARIGELESVHPQIAVLRREADAQLDALRAVSAERDAAREGFREQSEEARRLAGELQQARLEIAAVRQQITQSPEQSRQEVECLMARLSEAQEQIATLTRQSQEDQRADRQKQTWRVTRLARESQKAQQRVTELREQNAALTGDVLRLTREKQGIEAELRGILESPGWKVVERYRRWFSSHINSRPWLRNWYESLVWFFLRRLGGPRGGASGATGDSTASAALAPPEPRPPLSFEEWIRENEPDAAALAGQRNQAAALAYRPLISIVLPVYRVELSILKACVQSVLDQTYDRWELCIAHAAPEETAQREFLRSLAAADSRVKLVLLEENQGISTNSNRALELAGGEFVALLDHDDTLAPFAFYEVAHLLAADPDLELIYSDHDYIDETGSRRFNPLFKPDWSPEIMLSANYITHLTVLRLALVRELGGFDTASDGAQDWDLFLRATERTAQIAHIPRILYHWRTHSASTALNPGAKNYAEAAQLRSVQAHLDRMGLPARAEVSSGGLLRVRWMHPEQKRVSIIIPSRDKVDLLSRAINSLRAITAYPNYEILIVDNGSQEPATHQYYETIARLPGVRVLPYAHPFNFSAMNNYGAKHATGDLLLFLNNDVEITSPEWLEELAGWTQVRAVGVTGARLLRPNGTIQHAGVVIGFEGFAGHPFADQPALTFNIYGSTGWYRNFLAVTGACMMLRREVFDEIGGFDEAFITCGSDVEICLRAWRYGYRTVYNPFAELVHYECQTRKSDVPRQDYLVSFRHYEQHLRDGDPYWNPNLSRWDRNIGFHSQHEPSALAFAEGVLQELQAPAAGARETAAARAMPEAKEEDLFVSWFDHTPADIRLSKAAMAAVEGYRRVRRMIWFIPPFEHPFYGGIFTILRFADAWSRNEGVEHHFAICGSAACEEMLERIRQIHPQCTRASITILANAGDVDDLPEADACVATFWATAYYVLKFRNAPRKFYFIQDYEPSFYRAGSASALAENTYRFGFYGIANTISLKEVYEREYGGKAEYFTPCVDTAVFHPAAAAPAQPRTLQLFCYSRPQHPRNSFELLTAALRIVKSRLGDRVRIVCAGSEWDPRDYGVEGVVENLGLLSYEQTAELYRTSHAGAVLMLTRHPSYIPMELMASGCLVITNRNYWTKWLLRDEENCLLTDTAASCLAETIERGLTDDALRQRITGAALDMVRRRYTGWDAEMAHIYEFICNPEGEGKSTASAP